MKFQLFLCFFIFTISGVTAQMIDKEKLLEYYESQRYAEAAQYLQSIYPEDTKDIKALTQMAYCNMMSGKLPEAEENYLKVNAVEPGNIPVLFSLANINSRRGNAARLKRIFWKLFSWTVLISVPTSSCPALEILLNQSFSTLKKQIS